MAWDDWLLRRSNGMAGRWRALDLLMTLAARFSSVAEVVMVLLLPLAAGWKGVQTLRVAARALLLATGTVWLVQRLAPRPRPFTADSVRQLVARRPGPSFPSRHVASAFALAAAAWNAHRGLGSAMAMIGTLLGVSRVYSGLHYPSDVLAGAVVGLICGRVASRGGEPTSRE